jgi:glycosyltransferase involved in cell wall biosynthesis
MEKQYSQREYPLVSICVPAYNSAKYILETLQSLKEQTYPNIEVIIVDDGSTDETEEVVKNSTFSFKYHKQLNSGAGSARNRAFNLSNGDFIKFMDADDLLSNQSIEAQVNLALKHPASIISGKWGRFYNDDINTFKLSEEKVWRNMPSVKWIQESWTEGPNMTQPGIFLISRTLINETGLWDESLSRGPMDDMEYYTRLILTAKNITFSAESTLMYRSGMVGSLSKKISKEAMTIALKTIELSTACLIKFDSGLKSNEACSAQYQLFIYKVYPYFMSLYRKAKTQQKKFGTNDIKFSAGGYTKVLKCLFGWKMAKKLKLIFFNS